MQSRPRALIFASLLGALGTAELFFPAAAQACAPPRYPVVTLAGNPLSTDALLVGRQRCTTCEASELLIKDNLGTTITGTFLAVRHGLPDGTFAFEPEAAWDEARTYTVVAADYDEQDVSFSVGSGSAPEETFASELLVFKDSVSPVACVKSDDRYRGSCWEPSYSEQTNVLAGLKVSPEGVHQRALYVTWMADGKADASEYLIGPAARSHRFEGAPKEVCVKVRSLSILDDTNDVDLGENCVQTNTKIDTFGIVDVPGGDLTSLLQTCIEPPVGYEDEWCQLFAEQIAAQDCSTQFGLNCDQALLQCPEDTVPGTGGSGGASGDPDTSTETDFGPDDDMSAGCSLSGRASSTSGWWLLLGSPGLVLAWRRSRCARMSGLALDVAVRS